MNYYVKIHYYITYFNKLISIFYIYIYLIRLDKISMLFYFSLYFAAYSWAQKTRVYLTWAITLRICAASHAGDWQHFAVPLVIIIDVCPRLYCQGGSSMSIYNMASQTRHLQIGRRTKVCSLNVKITVYKYFTDLIWLSENIQKKKVLKIV